MWLAGRAVRMKTETAAYEKLSLSLAQKEQCRRHEPPLLREWVYSLITWTREGCLATNTVTSLPDVRTWTLGACCGLHAPIGSGGVVCWRSWRSTDDRC
jgi:hypothetical protein